MTDSRPGNFDIIIVGAGFAGMYQLHKAREPGFSAIVPDANAEVGGCWYSTRYPGLRCDIESILYSYSFNEEIQQEWVWPDKYSLQQDIADYAAFVADKLDLRRDIQFHTRVKAANWIAGDHQWEVETDKGERLRATFLVMATGSLSIPITPDIPGIESFAGQMFHSASWPRDLQSFEGRKVALIGTGSSGVQIATEAAKTADSLLVVQRTIPYVLELQNVPLEEARLREVKRNYRHVRRRAMSEGAGMIFSKLSRRPVTDFAPEELETEMERAWLEGSSCISQTFTDVMVNRESNEKIADFIRRKVRATIKDPAKAERVMPTTRYGAKRLAIATNYYDIFNRDNVDAIDITKTPIVRIHPDGIETTDGKFAIDTLILATGYDAGTGPLQHIDIRGENGVELKRKTSENPLIYLGLMSHGFPNMFIITGPGSPSVLTNMVFSIEQHVDFVSECVDYLRAHGKKRIEAEARAQDAWSDTVNEIANSTILMDIDTWYNGANVEGKKKCFMLFAGGLPAYEQKLNQVINDGYTGFVIS